MASASPLAQGKSLLRKLLKARGLRGLAHARLIDVVRRESLRARKRVPELERQFPSATPRELAHRLIEEKKGLAGMAGGVSGLFGVFSLPADQLVVLPWLQLRLLTELATLYGVNLKSDIAQRELVDLFWYANGVGQLPRTGPRVLGTVAGFLLARGGMRSVGRAIPLAGSAVSAYLNNQHLQAVGDEALRFYEGFSRAQKKTRGLDDQEGGQR